MPAGVEVFVEDGFATIDFTDRSRRADGFAKLLEHTPVGLIQTLTRSGPRRQYRVPEGNAREAGLIDESSGNGDSGEGDDAAQPGATGTYDPDPDTGFADALKAADPFAEADQSWHHPMPNVSDTAYGSGVGTVTGPLRPNKATAGTVPTVPADAAELHADLQQRVHDATDAITDPPLPPLRSEDPDETWKVDELREYARENEINLEGATRKDDIIEKIQNS
jgi:hypothetical protein